MAELDHLSYSSVSTYQLCARSWEYKYVWKIKTPTAPSLVFGSCFHESLETIIKAKAAGDASPPIADIWMSLWAERERGEEIDWQGELPENLCNLGLRMIASKDTAALLATITPMLNQDGEPILEMPVELRVPGVPIPVIGYIDMMGSDGVIYDFKTSARAWTQDKAEKEMQPAVYLAALSQMGYRQNPEMKFRHIVWTKTKTPQVQVVETQRRPVDLLRAMQIIGEIWKAIQAGIFLPRLDGWKHSPSYCEYWKWCSYGGK